MAGIQPHKLNTITEYHRFRRLPGPEHPLISVIDFNAIGPGDENEPPALVNGFYSIALKKTYNMTMRYGQQDYDFDSGTMIFVSPGQVYSVGGSEDATHSGWLLLVHPDFIWNTTLAANISRYDYFGYAVNEALHLSDKEEATITVIAENIKHEYKSNIDNFSHNVIVAQLELLLTYAERFYHRQFLTRKKANHEVLHRLEHILNKYFSNDQLLKTGIPSVQNVANELHMSPGYLGGLLRSLTGQSTQQHIHDKLIEKAKEKLSTTGMSVSEIAYQLGFEHPQSFNKLFKTKTNISPLEFRQSFN